MDYTSTSHSDPAFSDPSFSDPSFSDALYRYTLTAGARFTGSIQIPGDAGFSVQGRQPYTLEIERVVWDEVGGRKVYEARHRAYEDEQFVHIVLRGKSTDNTRAIEYSDGEVGTHSVTLTTDKSTDRTQYTTQRITRSIQRIALRHLHTNPAVIYTLTLPPRPTAVPHDLTRRIVKAF